MKYGTKMHLGVKNWNWLGAMQKLMSELFQGDFCFLPICLLVKMKMSDFLAFMFIIWVTPLDRPQENEKNETFPVSEEFIHERKLDIQIWLDRSSCTSRKLPFTASTSAAFKSRALCNSSLLKGLFISVTHFMNSNSRIFFFTCKYRELKQKEPLPSPRNDFQHRFSHSS